LPIIDWEARYLELKQTTDANIATLTEAKKTALTAQLAAERKLADAGIECQAKIRELEEKLKNANSSNPQIPGVDSFNTSTIFAELWRRALSALDFSKLKGGSK